MIASNNSLFISLQNYSIFDNSSNFVPLKEDKKRVKVG